MPIARPSRGKFLARIDGAGASHEVTQYLREAGIRFSVGFALTEPVRTAITEVPKVVWIKAVRPDGKKRKNSQVVEITDRVNLSNWPKNSRLIARRTKLKAGEQQSFADQDGYRFAVFLTDCKGGVSTLDLTHRGHPGVEDSIRQGKDCGLLNLPSNSFARNEVWLWLVGLAQDLFAWSQVICLEGDAQKWELKRSRYRLFHQSGRISRHARRTTLRLSRDWPWATELEAAFARMQALAPPALA